jgi:hypothetical protein
VLHFGDNLKPMTRRQRITVTNDAELAKALERMRPFFPGKPAAALVHDLAIKGAVAIEEDEPSFFDEVRREKGLERTADWSNFLDGLDRDILLNAEQGWGWNR